MEQVVELLQQYSGQKVSQSILARRLKCSVRTVQRKLYAAIEQGIIQSEGINGAACKYHLSDRSDDIQRQNACAKNEANRTQVRERAEPGRHVVSCRRRDNQMPQKTSEVVACVDINRSITVREKVSEAKQSDPRQKFRLRTNAEPADLKDFRFLRIAFDDALACSCVTELDFVMFVGLAMNCLEQEPETPVALFVWAMKNGRRLLKIDGEIKTLPWRAAVTEKNYWQAQVLISAAKPQEFKQRKPNSFGESQESTRESQLSALASKYGLKGKVG